MRTPKSPGTLAAGLAVVWGLAVSAGFYLFLEYEHTPGESGSAGPRWPTDTTTAFDPDKINLIVVAHPRCSCTRAALEELDRVLTRCNAPVRARALVYVPKDAGAGWSDAPLWNRARAVSGLEVVPDFDAAEAKRFGLVTSGHVVVYGTDGRLLFSGGVTRSRGHEGSNPGSDALLALLGDPSLPAVAGPVYGCSLETPPAAAPEECIECRQ